MARLEPLYGQLARNEPLQNVFHLSSGTERTVTKVTPLSEWHKTKRYRYPLNYQSGTKRNATDAPQLLEWHETNRCKWPSLDRNTWHGSDRKGWHGSNQNTHLAGKRKIKVTQTRKKADFAHFIKEVVDQDYPKAKKARLVLDNLNTHFSSSFYETFSKEEAERILGKIEFFYTPKHGSWLNMAEIEINMMDRECLARRIGQPETLINEINHWTENRNEAKKKILWKFTKQDADQKLAKHYVA